MELNSALRKINALLEMANDPRTPPNESQLARERADSLMLKYQIDEAMAAKRKVNHDDPDWLEMPVVKIGNEFVSQYRFMASVVAQHVGNLHQTYEYRDGELYAIVCGYPGALGFFQTMYTQAQLAFARKLEPTYDPNKSDAENAFIMRSAGMTRRRIADAIYGPLPEGSTMNALKARTRKVTRIAQEWAVANDEDMTDLFGQAGASMDTYRRTYAEAFTYELHTRARLYRLSVDKDEQGALVLVSIKERVDEAFYTRYPHLRPRPQAEREEYRSPNADCERCRKAKSGYCREHQWLKPSTATFKAQPHSYAADARGRAAAQDVRLGPDDKVRTQPAKPRPELG